MANGGRAKDALQSIARSLMSRRYSLTRDGAIIADQTPEAQIPGEIRDLLNQLAE